MKLEYFTIIYIIGFLLSYIMIKKFARINEYSNDWDDVAFTFLFSLFSWFTVIIATIFAYKKIFKIIGVKAFKPPRWL